MIKMIKMILMILFITACKPHLSSQMSQFAELSTIDLSTSKTFKLVSLQKDYNFPPYLWRKIWEAESTCLWYRTPAESEPGLIRLMDKKNCDDYTNSPILEVDGVHQFNLSLQNELQVSIHANQHDYDFKFSLTNIEEIIRGDEIINRLDAKDELSTAARLINGRSLRVYKNKFTQLQQYPKLGSLELSYQHKKAIFCHRFDEQCNETKAFDCDSCLGGWSEVVSHRCDAGKTTKICGRDRCGEKGEPACPRGIHHMIDEESFCFEGSRAGFCQDGLVTSCDENHVLICL